MSPADSANSDEFKSPVSSGKAGGEINWTISGRNRVHHVVRQLAELDVPGLAAAVSAGIPVEFVEALLSELSLSQRQAGEMLGLNRATLGRRHREGQRLDASESDRVIDLARLLGLVLVHAPNSIEGRKSAADALTAWLNASHAGLGHQAPRTVMPWGFGRAQIVLLLQQDFAKGRLK